MPREEERQLSPEEIKPYTLLSFDEKSPEKNDNKLNRGKNIKESYDEGFKKGYDEGVKKGYEAGFNEGFAKGYKEGLEKSQNEIKERTNEVVMVIKIFKKIIQELKEFKQKQIEFFLPQILKLSFKIAEKVVATKISLDREVTLSIVKDALESVPINEEKIIIKVHPDDYSLISKKIGELEIDSTRFQIEPSTEVTKGGCSIETQSQHIVSTIEQRLKEIENALNSVLSQ